MRTGTGFHPSDPDYTEGRGIALSEAQAVANFTAQKARRKPKIKKS